MQGLRDGGDDADIGRHILPLVAIATGGGEGEGAVQVGEGDGQPVDLRLPNKDERLAGAEETLGAFDEAGEILRAEGVVEREHRHGVTDFGETAGGRGTNAAGGRIGADQIGEGGFDGAVVADERVVFRVGDQRGVLLVIGAVIFGDQASEAGEFGLGGFGRGWHDVAHAAPIRLAAAARAASVTISPASMRAISS